MRHIANERVSLSVVQRCRPVLPDGGIGRHIEPIRLAAIKRLASLVLNAHQIELAFP